MTDHADTIRQWLDDVIVDVDHPVRVVEDALGALVAERQQAIGERDKLEEMLQVADDLIQAMNDERETYTRIREEAHKIAASTVTNRDVGDS